MFKISSNYTFYCYVFGISRNAGYKTTNSSYNHINLYTFVRSFNKFFNYNFISKWVALKSYVSFLTFCYFFDFIVNKLHYFALHTFRWYKKMLCFFNYLFQTYFVEDFCYFFSNIFVSCHQWQVSVKLWRLLVIIACSNLCNMLNLIVFLIWNKTNFWMNFCMVDSVNNSASCIFHSPWPLNIVLFIKSCSKFNHYHNFFSVFGRVN